MDRDIPESDWRIFRDLREVALERYCQRVLGEVQNLIADGSKSVHDRYVGLYHLIKQRDKELQRSFDSLRRSTALLQLAHFQHKTLLSDAEVGQLSDQTRERVRQLMQIW